MGDPKKTRKKYQTPDHPWKRERIEEEKELVEEYGFKNRKEIWKLKSLLRTSAAQAKKLVTLSGPQAETEKTLLLTRLKRYGFLKAEDDLDKCLSISLRDILERRLQTMVYKKGLANSAKQSRQFITHGHICVNGKVLTSPGYLVPLSEENQVSFKTNSNLSNPEHPERAAAKKSKEMRAVEDKDGKKEEKPKEFDKRQGGFNKGFKKDDKRKERPRRFDKKKPEKKGN